MSAIQRVTKAAYGLFSKVSVGSSHFNEHLRDLAGMMDKLKASDLNFIFHDDASIQQKVETGEQAPVLYMHLWEDHVMSMGVFIVRQGCSIPIHNHPNMYGICKVIQGTAHIQSYSPVDSDGRKLPDAKKTSVKSSLLSMFNRRDSIDMLSVLKLPDVTMTVNDSSCVVTPSDGNIHEIASVDGPMAFVDILAPPYDHVTGQRVCQYYEKYKWDTPTKAEGEIHWLMGIDPPNSFWCDTMDYTGPSLGLE